MTDRTATPPPGLIVAYGVLPAHALLREEAARFHQVPPERIVVAHECPRCGSDEHGRPHLLPTASVRHPAYVSLAREGYLSVVAITDVGPVGVDVEAVGAADFPGFVDVALHPEERASGATDPTRAWVRKEALLKAHGLGLAIDPSDVRIDDAGSVTWGSAHRPPGRVWVRDLEVPDHVVSAVVLPDQGQLLMDVAVTVRTSLPR